MKPEESPGCHQTRPSPCGWGLGSIMSTVDRASFLLCISLAIDSLVDVQPHCRPKSVKTDHINSISSQQLVVDCGMPQLYLYQYQCCNKNI